MSRKLIVIGGGAHGRVVMSAAKHAGWDVLGYTDRRPCHPEPLAPYLGTDDAIANHPTVSVALGVGSVRADTVRKSIVERIGLPAERWATIIEPSALVDPDAQLDPGVVVLAGSVIRSRSVIGPHALINSMVMVDHDCVVGDYTHLCPGVIMGGGASIGPHSLMGINSCLRDHTALGSHVTVGMGAVVTKAFGDGYVLTGSPAKPHLRVGVGTEAPRGMEAA